MSDNAIFRRTWIDHTVDVDVERTQLFDLLRDIDNWPSFTPGLRRIVRRAAGPVRVGTRFAMVVKMPRTPTIVLPCKVYRLEESHMEWGGGGFGSIIRHRFDLESLPDGRTRMRQIEYATGLLALLTLPLERAAYNYDRGWSDAIRDRFAGSGSASA